MEFEFKLTWMYLLMHSGLRKHMFDMFVKVANKFEVFCVRTKANPAIYLGLMYRMQTVLLF